MSLINFLKRILSRREVPLEVLHPELARFIDNAFEPSSAGNQKLHEDVMYLRILWNPSKKELRVSGFKVPPKNRNQGTGSSVLSYLEKKAGAGMTIRVTYPEGTEDGARTLVPFLSKRSYSSFEGIDWIKEIPSVDKH
jgi:hypothetical protein